MVQRFRTLPPRYSLVLVVVLFFIGLPTVIDSFQAGEWAQALVLAIAIMGLNILVGYSGQLSLGHGAFMALGAYISAILAHRYKMDYLLTIPIAGLLSGVDRLLVRRARPATLRALPRARHLCARRRCAEPDQATGGA